MRNTPLILCCACIPFVLLLQCTPNTNRKETDTLADDSDSAMKIVGDWFEKGKALKDEYFKDLGLDIERAEVEAEFQKHEAWKKKSEIRATPTVLVNGYKLPENYKIEDLQNFTEINIDNI